VAAEEQLLQDHQPVTWGRTLVTFTPPTEITGKTASGSEAVSSTVTVSPGAASSGIGLEERRDANTTTGAVSAHSQRVNYQDNTDRR
jgi:hypothetical protein